MVEIILDASQLELFEKCPRAWYYAYVRNLTPIHSKQAFATGSYYHEVLALFYHLPLTCLIVTSVKTSVEPELWQMRCKRIGPTQDVAARIRAAMDFAADGALLDKYLPKDLDIRKFHRQRLVDYFYKYALEDESLEPIAVEQGFSTLLYEDNDRRYILEGKIDLVCRSKHFGFAVMDHKTQSRKDDRWEFNHQVCNYLSFTKADYFIYNYIGLQDKLPPDGIRRTIYKPHPGMLRQWKHEVTNTFDEMYNYMTTFIETPLIVAENDYPRRRHACDSDKYGLCQFHKLCSVPDDSPFKNAVLSHYREKDNKWRAWT